MKKILLTIILFVSGSFFVFAQNPCSENGRFGYLNAQGVCVAAATPGEVDTSPLVSLLILAQKVVGRLVPLLIGLALLAFFWFLVGFIWKGREDPKEQKKSLSGMGWSIVALFVMVSVWGIIGFMGSVVGINQGGTMSGFKLPGEQ